MAKITVTIGIPAYNEEANIALLLKRLLEQNTRNFDLRKIIVVSDCSTDNTIKEVKSVKDSRIQILRNSKRLGLNGSQNKIFENSTQNVVILLNGDILPDSKNFLCQMVRPFIDDSSVSLVGALTIPVEPVTTIEKILFASHMWKNEISKMWNKGDNVLSCRGQARAFKKEFYDQLRWPQDVPEDAYSYYFCKNEGSSFVFNPRAQALFRLPQNLDDHIKQSHRYFQGHQRLNNHFGNGFVRKGYSIPLSIIICTFLPVVFVYHVYFLAYFVLMIYVGMFAPQQMSNASTFDIAVSSKKLVLE